MNITYRITLTIIFSVAILTTIIYLIVKPSDVKLLSDEAWCVDHIYFKNKLIGPKGIQNMYVKYSNGNVPCFEIADFRKTGDLFLPAVNSFGIYGTWKLSSDGEVLLSVDSLKNIFEGSYKIDVSANKLTLTSKVTKIYAHKDKTTMPDLF